jgi:hypothetical protein
MDIPIRIRYPFTPSDALDRHIERCLDQALRTHRLNVRRVDVHLADANGPKRGPTDKVTVIEIALRPFGAVISRGRASDVYDSVHKAAVRAKHALGRQASRLVTRRLPRRSEAGQ